MFKILGFILILTSCGGLGLISSMKLHKRLRELQQFKDFLNALSRELTYSMESVDDLLHDLYNSTEFMKMPILKLYIKEEKLKIDPFPKRWRNAVNLSSMDVNSTELEEIASLSEILGAMDLPLQLQAINSLSGKMDIRIREASLYYEKYGRLYRTLGVITGIGICIMMI